MSESREQESAGTTPAEAAVARFGADLRRCREAKGLTQQEAAARIRFTRAGTAQLEAGHRLPPWRVVAAYLEATDQDPAEWEARFEEVRLAVATARDGGHDPSPSPGGPEAIGPTGLRVGRRVAELRRTRGWTLSELEAQLAALGRPILLSAISKIEQGQRRVDVDDLVGLALALDVSPNMLLLPGEALEAEVPLTPGRKLSSAAAWSWAARDAPRPPFELATDPQPSFDFYISSAGSEAAWAGWIAQTLEEAGHRVWLATQQIRFGDKLTTAVSDGLRRSRRLLAVLSPGLTSSSWATAELMAALRRDDDVSRTSPPVLPVRVVDGPLPELLHDRLYVDLVGVDESTARTRLLRAAASGRSRPRPASSPVFPGTSAR